MATSRLAAYLRTSVAPRIVLGLVAIQIAGIVIGLRYAGHYLPFRDGNIFDKLLSWDGGWYLSIAQVGYRWQPNLPAIQANVAFFPLWPIVDRICIAMLGPSFKIGIVLASWACGLVSIFFFEKLARRTVGDAANTATALYGFWPASSFYLMGYPTGITCICAIAALNSYFSRRVWLAAACIGLGTASAPTIVFVGAPIGIHYLANQIGNQPLFIALRNAFGWMLLSLSGIFAFILYQQFALGDPLAFIKIQGAWGYSPPFLEKLGRLFTLSHDTFELRAGMHNILLGKRIFASGNSVIGGKEIQGGIQELVNFIFFIFSLIGLAAGSFLVKRHRLILISSGCAVIFGYIWFVMLTNANMLSTPRLIFPAVAVFLGLGALAHRTRFVKAALIGFFALISLMEMAFVVAGYWVV